MAIEVFYSKIKRMSRGMIFWGVYLNQIWIRIVKGTWDIHHHTYRLIWNCRYFITFDLVLKRDSFILSSVEYFSNSFHSLTQMENYLDYYSLIDCTALYTPGKTLYIFNKLHHWSLYDLFYSEIDEFYSHIN